MARLFVDLISGTTAEQLTTVSTTLKGEFLKKVPAVSGGDFVALTVDAEAAGGNPEVVHVTSHQSNSDTATIERGKEGTSARNHQSGVKVVAGLTAQAVEEISAMAAAASPIGSVQAFGGTEAPASWLLCDGRAVSRSQYAELFAVIGTTYGAGDGSTTFNVPDLRQRLPIGKAESGTASEMGETGGAIDHTHAGPAHTHTNPNTSSAGAHTHGSGTLSTGNAGSHSHSLGSTGSAGAHTHNIRFDGTTGSYGHDPSNPTHNRHNIVNGQHMTSAGAHTHSLPNTSSAGNHSHSIGGSTASAGNHSHTQGPTGSSGTGQTSAANPPYLVLNFIIRAV